MSNNRKPSLSVKFPPPPPWQLLKGQGGKSRFLDSRGFPIEVPDAYAWRPPGWPPLSLDYVRQCGQPDPELLRALRPRRRRSIEDVPTGGVV